MNNLQTEVLRDGGPFVAQQVGTMSKVINDLSSQFSNPENSMLAEVSKGLMASVKPGFLTQALETINDVKGQAGRILAERSSPGDKTPSR